MSDAEAELAKLIDDTCRKQSLAVVVALLEIELERARTDARQAKTRVDTVRRQLKRARTLQTKATAAVREWFPG